MSPGLQLLNAALCSAAALCLSVGSCSFITAETEPDTKCAAKPKLGSKRGWKATEMEMILCSLSPIQLLWPFVRWQMGSLKWNQRQINHPKIWVRLSLMLLWHHMDRYNAAITSFNQTIHHPSNPHPSDQILHVGFLLWLCVQHV